MPRGLRLLFLFGSVVCVSVCAGAQSASEMPVIPTRPLQLPLSGMPMPAGQVSVSQRTAAGGGSNGSVDVIESSVTVTAPYNGSVPTGPATAVEMQLTLQQALVMGLRTNLGALSQSASEQQARGQQGLAKSELLPQLNTVVSEAFEKDEPAYAGGQPAKHSDGLEVQLLRRAGGSAGPDGVRPGEDPQPAGRGRRTCRRRSRRRAMRGT